ncbi:MAG: class I SAM-dependent methyltransferase [Bacteroides sp.]|nr:class I SAM-dependent methyltransferase [Eubacterium sp.]MCM1418388.1 class I SAM-dependent methyltransferase [Roseburia sp.]MCM1462489.1 class I SAM-dependent methyltransferase [Bacteroides sp.]
MDARLSAIAALVRLDRRICDVGTDHALLPCLLYRRGAREIVACDVNDGPLKAARDAVFREGAGDAIQVIRSDGLRDVPPCDDVIVAGMGGELIARIVTECRFLTPDTRFILQPMTRAEALRRALYRAGFEIMLENGVSAGGRVYTVLLVRYTGEKTEIDDGFAFFGKNADPRYIASVDRRLRRLAEGDPYYHTLLRGT